MKEQKSVDLKGKIIHSLENMSVAFNEKEFLLVINNKDKEEKEEYILSIPAEVMVEVVKGMYSSGLAYQKNFNKDIGFVEREE